MGYSASTRRYASRLPVAAEHALDWAGRSESTGLFADLDLHALLDQNLSLNRAALAMGRSRAGPPARAMPERRVLIDLLKHESIAFTDATVDVNLSLMPHLRLRRIKKL